MTNTELKTILETLFVDFDYSVSENNFLPLQPEDDYPNITYYISETTAEVNPVKDTLVFSTTSDLNINIISILDDDWLTTSETIAESIKSILFTDPLLVQLVIGYTQTTSILHDRTEKPFGLVELTVRLDDIEEY